VVMSVSPCPARPVWTFLDLNGFDQQAYKVRQGEQPNGSCEDDWLRSQVCGFMINIYVIPVGIVILWRAFRFLEIDPLSPPLPGRLPVADLLMKHSQLADQCHRVTRVGSQER
jgi:hypothetical protein